MNLKKITTVTLASAMLMGATGCNLENKRQIDAILNVTDKYVEALNKFDAEGILELTNWDEDSDEYKEVKDLLNLDFYSTQVTKEELECYEYIASTIEYGYENGRITIEDDKASFKIQYTMVDWKNVFKDSYTRYEDVLPALKNCSDKIRVKDTLEFEKVKGEWKLTKTSQIKEAFSFVFALPNVDLSGSGSSGNTAPTDASHDSDSYKKAKEAYLKILEENKANIVEASRKFNMIPCGIYDIDDNGIPELFFFSGVDNDLFYSATLLIFTYNENAGEAMLVVEQPLIVYEGASGGMYQVYVTPSNLLITTAGGEESDFRYTTDVYNFNWEKEYSLRRNVITDYDKPEGQDVTIQYYKNDQKFDKDSYLAAMTTHCVNTKIRLAFNYDPATTDPDYMLNSVKNYVMLDYDSAVNELKAQG